MNLGDAWKLSTNDTLTIDEELKKLGGVSYTDNLLPKSFIRPCSTLTV